MKYAKHGYVYCIYNFKISLPTVIGYNSRWKYDTIYHVPIYYRLDFVYTINNFNIQNKNLSAKLFN